MKRRLMATILVLAMCGSILAGCGDKQQDDQNDQNSASGSNDATNSEDKDSEDKETEDKEKPVLTIWSERLDLPEEYSDQGDTPYWQAIEEATGVELSFVDSSGGADTLAILAGTNDLPDIIITWDYSMPGGVQKQLAEGNIIALNDLMESGQMPNLKAYLDSDPEADKLLKNDEGLYARAPMIRGKDSALVFGGNMIRQDWLDELGLEVPVTIQDMEDVMLAFKEKKGCDAGYASSSKDYSRMVNAFGVNEGMYVGADGNVHYGAIEDNYLEFLTLFNRWYELGILDPDAFTQDMDSFFAKIATGRTGLVFGFSGSGLGKIETMKAENPGMDYEPIANPVQKAGEEFPFDVSAYRVEAMGAMISADCENVEAAARVIDYVYGGDGYILSNFGIEGITYELVDGEYQFTEYVTNNPDEMSQTAALSPYKGPSEKLYIVDGLAHKMGFFSLDSQRLSLEVWATTAEGTAKNMPNLTLSTEASEEYAAIMNEIQTYVDEYKLKFIFGTEPLENFPKFVENIKNMNVDRAIEIQQAAYDGYLAR